jgi:hypothetical protein
LRHLEHEHHLLDRGCDLAQFLTVQHTVAIGIESTKQHLNRHIPGIYFAHAQEHLASLPRTLPLSNWWSISSLDTFSIHLLSIQLNGGVPG